MRHLLAPLALVLTAASCGGAVDGAPVRRSNVALPPVAESGLAGAAHELLPAGMRVRHEFSGARRCLAEDGSRISCAFIHAVGDRPRAVARRAEIVAAARARGWRATPPAVGEDAVTTLAFQRGKLEGRVMLARTADVAMVKVTPAPKPPDRAEARFVTTALAACGRFKKAVDRIPSSLPRDEGLARVRDEWHTLVGALAAIAPPPRLERRYARFLEDVREFEAALSPPQPRRVVAAMRRVDDSSRAVGLARCVPR